MKAGKRRIFLLLLAGLLFFQLKHPASADLMNVDGVLHYYDYNGREAEKIGIDVSFYNNQIDWHALRDQGIDFVLIRLGGRGWGSGRLYNDRQTGAFLRGAREAGLEIGAYFYSTARNSAEALEEAEAAIHKLDGIRLDLPLFIDMEDSGDYPNGRADSLSPMERAAVIRTFYETVEAAGYEGGLYASQGYLSYQLDRDAVLDLPLWLASYTVENRLPNYDRLYEIWQLTDSARFGGIDGPVDLNVIF